jgi:hypothetical protein
MDGLTNEENTENLKAARRSQTANVSSDMKYSQMGSNLSLIFTEKINKKFGADVELKDLIFDHGKYQGQIDENRKMHGEGIFIYNNDDFYEGEFVKGLREGEGEYTWKDGSTFVGTWKEDTKNGWGLYKTDNKECYCEWEMDVYKNYLPIKSNDVSIEVDLDLSKLACTDSIDISSKLLNAKSRDNFKSIFKCIHKYGSSKKKVSFILHSREQSNNFGEEISKNLISVFEEVQKEDKFNLDIEFLDPTAEDDNKVFFTSCKPSPYQSGNNSVEYNDSTNSTPSTSRKPSTKN